jgi:hypothetical protein
METIRMGGWVSAKYDDLKTATAVTTSSEDFQNIGHYYRLHGDDAPTAEFMFVCKVDVFEGQETRYFLKATNMPHTKDIYMSKLTPYCVKRTEATEEGPARIDARGYGAILPFMYTGGTHTIQWDNGDGTFWQIETDVDAQIRAAKEGLEDSRIPKPTPPKNLAGLRGVTRYYNDATIWSQPVVDKFEELGIRTWEVAVNPNFAGHEDLVKNKDEFRYFLEGIQNQFIRQIHEGRLRIVGVFLAEGKEPVIYDTPHMFHSNMPGLEDVVNGPITVSGLYNMRDSFTTEHMINTTESQYVRFTMASGEQRYFEWTYGGGQATNYKSRPMDEAEVRQLIFTPDFEHTYGRSKLARDYADQINKIKGHPLQSDSIEDHAAGVNLSIDGMQVSLKPMGVPGMPKVANTLDHSEMRQHTNILTQRGRDWVHLQDWKDKSMLRPMNKPHENPIVFAILAMLTFQRKAFKAGELRTEERFINTLSAASAAAAAATGTAAAEGRSLEGRCGRFMENAFPDMEHILGDGAIKRTILQLSQDSQGNQAMDSLHRDEEAALWIGIQVKSGQRDKDGDFVDFVNTFEKLRAKANEVGARCFGILVHYNGLKNKNAEGIIARECGLCIVSKEDRETTDQFEQRLRARIKKIRDYY